MERGLGAPGLRDLAHHIGVTDAAFAVDFMLKAQAQNVVVLGFIPGGYGL